ncbi:hypothetical protein JJB99_00970 [Bradyrhizobium diazoefficiens]|uniref:hypothetical protein n=1 Tax=Bradyrhizobium diazoefficiens TaxID=1355477 RepID=UPI00190A9A3A|nr:hypothetical protein [Bradyrhizobium diazoefficiens]QQO14801.1 hypothetical protein JJB99_00970 [Bradyrhizobium diazoefficiens]
MEFAHPFRTYCIATICIAINCSSSSAEVIVYKEACAHDAFEDWNLRCKINKNTFTADPTDFRTTAFREIRSITICASFNNGGALNIPATIVHNYNDGRQSKPTELFDSVKFQGSLTANRMSWVGTSPRLAPAWPRAWSMRADLLQTGRQNSFTYTATLLNGQQPVGEIRGSCSFLEDDK